MSDSHIEILMKNLDKLEHVESLVFKGEEFGLKSVKMVKPLIERPGIFKLRVLRLIDCKMPK